MFEADVEFHKQATIWQVYCFKNFFKNNIIINLFLFFSLYAKAHEYQCGHINNGIKCTGKPKLGEFTQVCIKKFLFK
jgi:hypothetical protein